eukprot:CAMPEP_0194358352 /NCGR_PEP_ID=MMETSP0174-20130528/5587_1 /TAXON_ID=216777 /ORGANISM="Proboscia alata, Strain PI-D3" /LENGTH=159 /DNA_ID=CAMNT_0039128641 /DNA_START=140 /DNA_END=619 /DNA_ORIENTATION=+
MIAGRRWLCGNSNSNRMPNIMRFVSATSESPPADHPITVQDYTVKERNPYDVHVYYSDDSALEKAMELREKMQRQFPWMNFYNPKGRPIGPHPLPMWEADFGHYDNRVRWDDVRTFIEREHGGLSVLIHPHSTDGDYADHTKNAFWAGDILELRIQGWR